MDSRKIVTQSIILVKICKVLGMKVLGRQGSHRKSLETKSDAESFSASPAASAADFGQFFGVVF